MPTSTVNTANNAPYDDDVDLRRYWRFLTAHWMVLGGCAVGGAVMAVALGSLSPSRYQATATLMNAMTGTAAVLTPATAKALLVTPGVASETIKELGLDRDGMTIQRFIDDAVDVQPVSGTSIVRLNVVLTDPAKARSAAALLATKVIEVSGRIGGHDVSSGARAAWQSQLNDADRSLKEAEDRLAAFQMSADLDKLQAQTASTVTQRTAMDRYAIDLESERARLATLEHELARQPVELSAQLPRDGATEALSTRQNLAGTEAVLTNPFANPVHAMLQYDIAQSRATISKLEGLERKTLAVTSGNEVSHQRSQLYRARLALARLQAEYDARTRIYNSVLSKYEETTGPTVTAPQVQLLDAPTQPDQPMPRQRRQYATLGGLVGVLLGLAVAAIIDARRRA